MNILPFQYFIITTPLSPNQIAEVLESHIEPRKKLRLRQVLPFPFCLFSSRNSPHFEGVYSAEGFDITRIILYQNSFLPRIKGRFQPGEQGMEIEVRMRMHPNVETLLVLLSIFGVLMMIIVGALMWRDSEAMLFLLGVFALGIIFWTVALVSFHLESRKARRLLLEMFRGTVVDRQQAEKTA